MVRRAAIALTWIVVSARAQGVERALLDAHNAVRDRVGVAPLQWSGELARYAQEWAETLVRRGDFTHRPNNRYGENLFMISGRAATPAEVVEEWANEAREYDYRSNACRGTCGHYTQIVWRGTKFVGCGNAASGRRQVWVCNYDPPGNWRGQRPY